MKRIIKRILIISGGTIVLVYIFFLGVWYVQSLEATPILSPSPTIEPTPDIRAEVNIDNLLIRFNEARLAAGLKQLGTDSTMDDMAQARADEMATDKVEYGHQGFRNRIKSGKIPAGWAEIITVAATPTIAVQEWLDSPTHRDIVLDPDAKAMGLGISEYIFVILVR